LAFLAFWGPVIALMERLYNASVDEDGKVPEQILLFVRIVFLIM